MTNKPPCCELCIANPLVQSYCKIPHCPCHTSPLQNLIRERETAFAVEWVRDDGILDVGVYEVESLKKFLRESIRLAFLAGMGEAKGCVKPWDVASDEDTIGAAGKYNARVAETLAAIEKKSREVGEIVKKV